MHPFISQTEVTTPTCAEKYNMLKADMWEQGLYYPNKKLENHMPFNINSVLTRKHNYGKMQHNKDNESCYTIIN
jgi:hypothetical protein